MKSWYLVCYDVRDEARLRRVQRLMLGYGRRLQYSIFRCELSQRDRERMKWELTKIMDDEDRLLVVSLCRACAKKVMVSGPEKEWPSERQTYEII